VPSTSYIFLGDFVDRGYNSLEVFTMLLLLKAKYPANMTLLRGNHESRQITQVRVTWCRPDSTTSCKALGSTEAHSLPLAPDLVHHCAGLWLLRRVSEKVWEPKCLEILHRSIRLPDTLGMATRPKIFLCWNVYICAQDSVKTFSVQALIDGKVLCVHGGLSPQIRTLDQIRTIKRVNEVPHEGPFCDLMWSDPEDINGFAISPRGAGWLFGGAVVHEFNKINGALHFTLPELCLFVGTCFCGFSVPVVRCCWTIVACM
jgi:hypothetical protein